LHYLRFYKVVTAPFCHASIEGCHADHEPTPWSHDETGALAVANPHRFAAQALSPPRSTYRTTPPRVSP